jgi:hypothetical protein
MRDDPLKAILDRVRTWPRQRQEDAAELLTLIEEHDRSPYRLSEEQVREVKERMADREAPTLTLDELDERLRRLGV